MNSPSPVIVEIDGQRFQWQPEEWQTIDCIEHVQDEFHLIDQGKSHWIKVLNFDLASRTCVLKVDGEIKKVKFLRDLDLMIERMGLNAMPVKKIQSLNAPMPGLVTAIKVVQGQQVDQGSPLIILEAMKMENVITAPHPVVVKSVVVTTGQAVEKGAILLEFE